MVLAAEHSNSEVMTESTDPDSAAGSTDTTQAPGPPGDPGPQTAHPSFRPSRPALRRSTTDRKIAGVAGGLGRHFDLDPLIFRVVLVTLAVFGGSGLLLYAVGWLLIPEDGEQESEGTRLINGRATSKVVAALILAVVGLVAVGNFAHTGWGFGGFAALVAVGLAAYLIYRSDHDRERPPQPVNPPPVPPGSQVATTRQHAAPPYASVAPGAYGQTPGTAYAAATATAPTPAAAPERPPRPRSPLGAVTASLALLVAGALVSWNLLTDHDVAGEAVLAASLAVVGLGLVVGGFSGRARGLIALGVVLTVAMSAVAVSHVTLRGGVGDRTWVPRTAAGVHATYRLGAGEATLDLSHVALSRGDRLDVAVRQGVGDLLIVLPAGVSADVVADVHAGEARMPRGPDRNGTSVHRHYVDPRGSVDPTVTIDAELGVGSLEVRRASS